MRPLGSACYALKLAAILCVLKTLAAQPDPAQIYRRASDAVVLITARNSHDSWRGSGFLVTADGTVVTNYHVIADAENASVQSSSATFTEVRVKSIDKRADIAVLIVNGSSLPHLDMACTSSPGVGDPVFSISNPLGLRNTFSQGIISAIRSIEDTTMLQTSAPISPGSSGGPLLDGQGSAIGVTSSTIVGGQNLNFAIAITHACELARGSFAGQPLDAYFAATHPVLTSAPVVPVPSPKTEQTPPGTLPAWWFNSNAATVSLDAAFQHLSLSDRQKVLQSIDPKFAKMSRGSQDHFLWAAEKRSLPRATPVRVVPWVAGEACCSVNVSSGSLTKTLVDPEVEVTASVGWHVYPVAHLAIRNHSSKSLHISPRAFTMRVVSPKTQILTYVDFEWVQRSVIRGALSLNLTSDIYSNVFSGLASSGAAALKECELEPQQETKGDVYFDYFDHARRANTVVLHIFVDGVQFDIPLPWPAS